jgi:hypothetical protein
MKARSSFALYLITSSLAFGGALGCGDDTGTTTNDAGGADATKDTGGGGIDSSVADTGGGEDTGTAETGGDDTGVSEGGEDTGAGEAGGEGGSGEGGTDAGTEGGTDGGVGLDCTSYCTLVMANCTGNNAQYQSAPECMNACAQLPLGMLQDKMGDTVGCRIYHAGLAATLPNPHCWHAGPYGFGVCGSNCDDFCAIATSWCTAAGGFDAGMAPYGNLGDCKSACNMFTVLDGGADPGVYNAAGPQSGNTLDCREWHLGAALGSTAAQQVHCFHVGAMAIGSNPFPCH